MAAKPYSMHSAGQRNGDDIYHVYRAADQKYAGTLRFNPRTHGSEGVMVRTRKITVIITEAEREIITQGLALVKDAAPAILSDQDRRELSRAITRIKLKMGLGK